MKISINSGEIKEDFVAFAETLQFLYSHIIMIIVMKI